MYVSVVSWRAHFRPFDLVLTVCSVGASVGLTGELKADPTRAGALPTRKRRLDRTQDGIEAEARRIRVDEELDRHRLPGERRPEMGAIDAGRFVAARIVGGLALKREKRTGAPQARRDGESGEPRAQFAPPSWERTWSSGSLATLRMPSLDVRMRLTPLDVGYQCPESSVARKSK